MGKRGPKNPAWDSQVERVGDCLVWIGGRFGNGYGRISLNGKTRGAHRVAYERAFGPIAEGWFVCHRCDNRPCVEPAHLFLGTPADNQADMRAKGRGLRGRAIHSARLDEAAVRRIRDGLDRGLTKAEIARREGVAEQTVRCVAQRRTWGWVR